MGSSIISRSKRSEVKPVLKNTFEKNQSRKQSILTPKYILVIKIIDKYNWNRIPIYEVKMRYILGLPTDHVESIDQFGTSQAIVEMATTAEKLDSQVFS